MMAAPPSEDGTVQATNDEASAFEVAMTPVGAPGTVTRATGAEGVAGAEGVDAGPVPAVLVAVTVNV